MRKSPYGIYSHIEGKENVTIGKPKLLATTFDGWSLGKMLSVQQAQESRGGAQSIAIPVSRGKMRENEIPKISLSATNLPEQRQRRPLSEISPTTSQSALNIRYEFQNQRKELPQLPVSANKPKEPEAEHNSRHKRSASHSGTLEERHSAARPTTPNERPTREPWQGASGISAQLTPIRDVPVSTTSSRTSTPTKNGHSLGYIPYRAIGDLPTPGSREHLTSRKPTPPMANAPATPDFSRLDAMGNSHKDTASRGLPTFMTPISAPSQAQRSSLPPLSSPRYENERVVSRFSWTTHETPTMDPGTPATCTTIETWGSPAFASPLKRKPVNSTDQSRFSWTTVGSDRKVQMSSPQQPRPGLPPARRLDWLDMSSPNPPARNKLRSIYNTPDPYQPPQIPPRSVKRSFTPTSGDVMSALNLPLTPSFLREEPTSRFSWSTCATDVTAIAEISSTPPPPVPVTNGPSSWRTYGAGTDAPTTKVSSKTSSRPATFGRPLPVEYQKPQQTKTATAAASAITPPLPSHRTNPPILARPRPRHMTPPTSPSTKPLPSPPHSPSPGPPALTTNTTTNTSNITTSTSSTTIPPTPLEAELDRLTHQRELLELQLTRLRNATVIGWERVRRRKEDVARLEAEVADVRMREQEVGVRVWRAARRRGGEGGLWVRRVVEG